VRNSRGRFLYRKGYKYQLADKYWQFVDIYPPEPIETDWISLSTAGLLELKKGYAWNGASRPAIDTPSSIRGSALHDAGYQLMTLGLLPQNCRPAVDKLLRDTCIDAGMLHVRAEIWEEAVEHFAADHAKVGSVDPVLVAP